MSGADSPIRPPRAAAPAAEPPLPTPLSAIPLADAPILLLILFHKALRAEIAELRHLAVVAAAESGSQGGGGGGDLVVELHRRFEFLNLVYKYHCSAEDEIIFLALDVRIKNVACTYSLEHTCIDNLFTSVFQCISALIEDQETISKPFQELVFSIGTLQATICQHIQKEEQQVFPLLMQQFSAKEQASLVWQFLCSIPIMLLEDFLPWMTSFLSPDEHVDFVHCIKEVAPKETLLQEVVVSWLGNGKTSTETGSFKYLPKLYSSKNHFGENFDWGKAYSLEQSVGRNLLDGLNLWHGAIRKNLKEILKELYQIGSSKNFATLESELVQLKFLADILIFYGIALDKVFYPMLAKLKGNLPPTHELFPYESQTEDLQRLLHCDVHEEIPLCTFVDKLCKELESFVMGTSKYLIFQETEVFPLISKNCSHEMQKGLLFKSLHLMPLGLLKCVVTWFTAYLSDDEIKSILRGIKRPGPLVDKSFASLLHEWVRVGYSGKTSVEKFQKDISEMFKCRNSLHSREIKEDTGFCKPSIANTSYSSGLNLHIFFPHAPKILWPTTKVCAKKSGVEPRPIDHIYFFHKALKKNLEYLVVCSAKMCENTGSFMDFHRRFHLVHSLYQNHTDGEDDVAFPALEAKGKLKNISHSYSIDHKIEVEHFKNISIILDKMSGLHVSVDSKVFYQLSTELHDTCKTMQKILCDHVNREDIELWALVGECFSVEEQEKIIGRILGRTRAEILRELIPWLMKSLTQEEQEAMMLVWRSTTKNTMFGEWLGEWWDPTSRCDVGEVVDKLTIPIPPSLTAEALEVAVTYLSKESICEGNLRFLEKDLDGESIGLCSDLNIDDQAKVPKGKEISRGTKNCEGEKKAFNEGKGVIDCLDKPGKLLQVSQKFSHWEHLLTLSQDDLEAAIRRVSRDSSLDPQKKSRVIQNLLMSRWIVTQQLEASATENGEDIPGQCPSHRDQLKQEFGCKHYKRNCKLLAPCCKQLYTCIRCHDDEADHSIDRKSITKMMCMKCLVIQPIAPSCSTVSCNNLSMARYYCRICKLFDDEREIYHCPYCNLCRLGKGLGIDYFHCMTCNACMSPSLSVHLCREKCLEDNCPICHEYIFTSSSPVKGLPCGHLMHSTCFQDYTCTHYTCPICSKSLGDMQVYFGMLDALLDEEKIPDEYTGQSQVILCNDCEKKGSAPFHWLYHKCPSCGSYNTRLL